MRLANWAELMWNQNQRLLAENATLQEQHAEASAVIDSIVQASLQNQPRGAIDPPVYVPPPSTLEEDEARG
jgi:hypothetical protein